VAWGVPLDERHEYAGTFLSLLHPYALLVGVTTLALFMMHGAIYVVMKAEGELQQTARGWVRNTMIFFILCYVLTTMATLLYVPHMASRLRTHPELFVLPVLNVLAIANIPREIHLGREFRAFLSSCAAIAVLVTLFGVNMYPNLILSNPVPSHSLDIYNASSSHQTLTTMLYVAIAGMPFVIGYTAVIYWVFRGKVKMDATSY
jgi:cytochrome d ubiquinol oxidase subunit II